MYKKSKNKILTSVMVVILFFVTIYPHKIFSAPVTINLQVSGLFNDTTMASIANDSGRNVTNSGIITGANTLEPGSHGSNDEWSAGVRFTGVNIPQGRTISSATFSLRTQSPWCNGGDIIKYHVSTQASDNAPISAGAAGDLNTTARPRSTADAGTWDQSCTTASSLETVNVTNIVQEVISRAGWVSGNAIMILIDTHADTTQGQWQAYESFDSNASEAPRLDITYDDGTGSGSGSKVRIRGGIRVRGLVKFR